MTKPMRFYYRSCWFDNAGRFVPGEPLGVADEALAIEAARPLSPPDRSGAPSGPGPDGVEAVVKRRLAQICDTLGLAPDYFSAANAGAEAARAIDSERSDHARLAEAFDDLSDPLLRRRVFDLLAQLGSRR